MPKLTQRFTYSSYMLFVRLNALLNYALTDITFLANNCVYCSFPDIFMSFNINWDFLYPSKYCNAHAEISQSRSLADSIAFFTRYALHVSYIPCSGRCTV